MIQKFEAVAFVVEAATSVAKVAKDEEAAIVPVFKYVVDVAAATDPLQDPVVKGHAPLAVGHVVRHVSPVRQKTVDESAVVEAFVTIRRFPASLNEKLALSSVRRVLSLKGTEPV